MRLPFLRKTGSRPTLSDRLRQLAILAGLALVICYVGGVTAGYLWLSQVRKIEHVSPIDVALFRVQNVRRAMAAQQFARAQVEWDAKNYQGAYVAFSTAVRQDPDNVTGRIAAARFFRAVGAAKLGQVLLEEGLARAPDDLRLIEPTFDNNITLGRERRVLEMLHSIYQPGFPGPNQLLLQSYEVLATFTGEGLGAAKKLLDRYPGLLNYPRAAPVVSRIFWESSEKGRAVDLLTDFIHTQSAVFPQYAQLAEWQSAMGRKDAAVRTVEQACTKFPIDLQPRVLLIGLQAAAAAGRPDAKEIENYLRNYADRPEAIPMLAELAGSRGWLDLVHGLYELGAIRHVRLDVLGIYYCDALVRNSHLAEAQSMLGQIEDQAADAGAPFLVQLRERQIIVAAALGQTEMIRDYARRLGTTLGNDEDGLEFCRRIFRRLNITEAVAELTPRVAPVKAPLTTARK